MRNVNPKILGAFAVGFLMVGSAFFLSQNQEPSVVAATVIEAAPKEHSVYRTFIPVDDENDDGVPDWQEPFASIKIDLDEIGTTTNTSSQTAKLAREFGNQMLTTGSYSPTGVLNAVKEQSEDKVFTSDDIIVLQEDSQALRRNYGNRVAEIAEANATTAEIENELVILRRALIADKPEVLEELDIIIAGYEGMLEDMLAEPVPESLVEEHLALINVYLALLTNIKAFRGVFEDALTSLTRYGRYPKDVRELQAAIVALYQKLHDEGIRWSEEDAASKLIEIKS